VKSHTFLIKETINLFGQPGILLSGSQIQQSFPGQYFLASSEEVETALPTVLYHFKTNQTGSLFSGLLPNSWLPSMELAIRGPLGNGFTRPVQFRKVALAVIPGANITPLLSLASELLQDHMEVALLMDSAPNMLAPEIELLPLNAIQDATSWADTFFVITPLELINETVKLFSDRAQLFKPIEIMVQTSYVCGGMAECGVCSVLTKKGWKLACKAGPVFSMKDLEYEF
jgi:NAD(P)H-flavin reductase